MASGEPTDTAPTKNESPEWRDIVLKAKKPKSEPRRVNERVAFELSSTETPIWTVAKVETRARIVGDSTQVYQLRMSNGELYNNGEFVAQNRLRDA